MTMRRALSAHKVIVAALIAGAGLLAACGEASVPQQTATTGQAQAAPQEQARKDADDKAWADALREGTAAAFNVYLQNLGSGAHVAEARSRLALLEQQAGKEADDRAWAEAARTGTAGAFNAYVRRFGNGAHVAEARTRLAQLDEQARKEVDEKAWAEAVRAGTAAAFNGYIQKFPSGAHVAEARTRLAALEAKARKDADAMRGALAAIPTVDIRKTCATAAGVAGAKPTEESMSGCLQSEQAARESIAQQWAQFTSTDRSRCITPKAYLPSYVEWLTCLEMERDVRNLRREPTPGMPKR